MTIKQEFEIKIGRIRALMEEKDLDGIFLKRQDDFAYLSCGGRNYVGAGDMGNCGLLVTKRGHYAITNNIEAPRMLAEENIGELGFEMRASFWHDSSFEARTLAELVPSGKLGKDFGVENNVAEDIKTLRRDLTEAEVERYLAMGAEASEAMESVALTIKAGETEYEIAARIMAKMEEKGLELLSCMVAGDDRIRSYRHPLPTSNRVNKIVQMGGNFRRNGLIVCLTRYVALEAPSEEYLRQFRANQIVDCTLIASTKAGRPFSEALLKGKAKYEELGYADEINKHHQGGPIGYAGRDYRVDFNTSALASGTQAMCWNPSITGSKSEDTYIVRNGECIPVTKPVLFPAVEIEVDGVTFTRPDIYIMK